MIMYTIMYQRLGHHTTARQTHSASGETLRWPPKLCCTKLHSAYRSSYIVLQYSGYIVIVIVAHDLSVSVQQRQTQSYEYSRVCPTATQIKCKDSTLYNDTSTISHVHVLEFSRSIAA
eukprot:scpid100864/ scgid14027/ 